VGVITRGWADPQNYKSLTRGGNYDSKLKGEPLVPGKFYDLTFDLQPGDRLVAYGKRLGLMIMSSDRDFTLWPKAGTELMIDLGGTSIRLPVVGGAEVMKRAVGR
jgi:X-Pro dipeptidyl-peptidase